jgi:hypothetical protein
MELAIAELMRVRQQLLVDDPTIADDERLFSDLLSGEGGDAMEVVNRLVRAALHAGSMATAAKVRVLDLEQRAQRYANREKSLRAAVMSVLEALGMKRHEEPDFSVSISAGSPSVQIIDAGALPDAFVVTERRPDKVVISAALKAGQEVPGATLSNSGPRITIRTR